MSTVCTGEECHRRSRVAAAARSRMITPLLLAMGLYCLLSLATTQILQVQADATGYSMDGVTPLCWFSCVTLNDTTPTVDGSGNITKILPPFPATDPQDFKDCPSGISAAGFQRPFRKSADSLEPFSSAVEFSYSGPTSDIICTPSTAAGGGCDDISHVNIHACKATVSLCSPFVNNVTDLSTHSPTIAANLTRGSLTINTAKVAFQEGLYTLIAHFRFLYRPSGSATICRVEAASATPFVVNASSAAVATTTPPTTSSPTTATSTATQNDNKEGGNSGGKLPTWTYAVIGAVAAVVLLAGIAASIYIYGLHKRAANAQSYPTPPSSCSVEDPPGGGTGGGPAAIAAYTNGGYYTYDDMAVPGVMHQQNPHGQAGPMMYPQVFPDGSAQLQQVNQLPQQQQRQEPSDQQNGETTGDNSSANEDSQGFGRPSSGGGGDGGSALSGGSATSAVTLPFLAPPPPPPQSNYRTSSTNMQREAPADPTITRQSGTPGNNSRTPSPNPVVGPLSRTSSSTGKDLARAQSQRAVMQQIGISGSPATTAGVIAVSPERREPLPPPSQGQQTPALYHNSMDQIFLLSQQQRQLDEQQNQSRRRVTQQQGENGQHYHHGYFYAGGDSGGGAPPPRSPNAGGARNGRSATQIDL